MGIKNNNYVEIKNGDRVTLRNGDILTFDEYYDKIVNSEDSRTKYDENLKHLHRKELDIVEIKRPVEFETIFSEDDRTEVEAEETDDLKQEIIEKLSDIDLKAGNIIVIKL